MSEIVERHGERVFKHTGDGICAVFDSARSAIAAAVDAQHELELPVRTGLHTGEVEERDGDFSGPTLNRCARGKPHLDPLTGTGRTEINSVSAWGPPARIPVRVSRAHPCRSSVHCRHRADALAADLGTNRSELMRRGAQALLDAERLAAADHELRAAYRRQPADPTLVQSARRLAAETAPTW